MGYKLGSFNMYKFQAYRSDDKVKKSDSFPILRKHLGRGVIGRKNTLLRYLMQRKKTIHT